MRRLAFSILFLFFGYLLFPVISPWARKMDEAEVMEKKEMVHGEVLSNIKVANSAAIKIKPFAQEEPILILYGNQEMPPIGDTIHCEVIPIHIVTVNDRSFWLYRAL